MLTNPHLKRFLNASALMAKTFSIWVFYFIPFFLLGIFFVLLGTYFYLKQETQKEKLLAPLISSEGGITYPILTIPKNANISAGTAVVIDSNSGVIVYAKNPQVRFSPASTAKIMTALVGLNTYQLDDVLTVRGPLDTEGSGLGLIIGETMTFRNLLVGMFLPSANDAAQTVAENYPNGEQAFVSQMNKEAQLYHLNNTHFGDPAGLEDDINYTTVLDLARLTSVLLKNPIIREIINQKVATITTADGLISFDIKNRNILVGLYGINGVKTGYTDGAKEVLVTSVQRGNHSYIIVVMDSDDRFADTLKLVQNILPNITYTDLIM